MGGYVLYMFGKDLELRGQMRCCSESHKWNDRIDVDAKMRRPQGVPRLGDNEVKRVRKTAGV